jgi:hypothetical protein
MPAALLHALTPASIEEGVVTTPTLGSRVLPWGSRREWCCSPAHRCWVGMTLPQVRESNGERLDDKEWRKEEEGGDGLEAHQSHNSIGYSGNLNMLSPIQV